MLTSGSSTALLSTPASTPNSKLPVSAAGSTSKGQQGAESHLQATRLKNKKRDDAIRKRAEIDLLKQSQSKRASSTLMPSASPGYSAARGNRASVSTLRPSTPVLLPDTATIYQACQLMAAKKSDAVLCVNGRQELVGILTDKDIAYRVVAKRLNPQVTVVSSIYTPNPTTVLDSGNRNDALDIMVTRRFRHLPVVSESGSIVGILDITKCVFDRLGDFERKVEEDDIIIAAMEALERRGSIDHSQSVQVTLGKGCPSIAVSLLKSHADIDDASEHTEHAEILSASSVPRMTGKDSVREAAVIMKENASTAILITDPSHPDSVAGIFTTKDIVLRVVAAGLDPGITSCFRVMTLHPDSVGPDCSLLNALLKMRAGHYLHLPVLSIGNPVGLVDVLTLTVAMLKYLMNSSAATDDSEEGRNVVWNNFWNQGSVAPKPSSLSNSDWDAHSEDSSMLHSVSTVAGPTSPQSHSNGSQFFPMDQSPAKSLDLAQRELDGNSEFSFKVASYLASRSVPAYSRFTCAVSEFFDHIGNKFSLVVTGLNSANVVDLVVDDEMGCEGEVDGINSASGKAASRCGTINQLVLLSDQGLPIPLAYRDDEGDVIFIKSAQDLDEAVAAAKRDHASRLLVILGTPDVDAGSLDAVSSSAKPGQRASRTALPLESDCDQGHVDDEVAKKTRPAPSADSTPLAWWSSDQIASFPFLTNRLAFGGTVTALFMIGLVAWLKRK